MLSRFFVCLIVSFSIVPLIGQSTSINLKVFLEGPYNSTTGRMDTKLHDLGYLPGMQPKTFFAKAVSSEDPYNPPTLKSSNTLDVSLYSQRSVDWIQVSILDDGGKAAWVGTLLLESDGQVITNHIKNLTLDETKLYRVYVTHRNHMPARSPLLSVENNEISFDFTRADTVGLKDMDGTVVMRGGALRSLATDGYIIEKADIDKWEDFNGQNSSYLLADIDMDGDVSVHDKSIILSNLDASITLE